MLGGVTPGATAAEPVTLALNWKAQPELGGFYQALAAGHYEARGLDVAIRVGGPLVNNRPLLPVGQADFLVGTNLLPAFDATRQGIPTVVVAAFFQRDPQCLIAHADGPLQTWDDLKRAPLLLGSPGRHSFWVWLRTAHGFDPAMARPYNHSLAPFLVNKGWAMQGYSTAEPRRVVEATGVAPRVFLLADHGWESYSTVLETRRDLVESNPELVRAFVEASVLGWYEYLYGDPAEANRLILAENRDLSASQVAGSIAAMRDGGLVDSGDALKRGVGAIDGARVVAFHRAMIDAGLVEEGALDPRRVYTDRFVGRGFGLERRAELLAGGAAATSPSR